MHHLTPHIAEMEQKILNNLFYTIGQNIRNTIKFRLCDSCETDFFVYKIESEYEDCFVCDDCVIAFALLGCDMKITEMPF